MKHPADIARNTEDKEPAVRHRAYACDERGKCPDYGHEPCDDNRFPAVPHVELVRPVEMPPVEKAGASAGKDLRACLAADPVVR